MVDEHFVRAHEQPAVTLGRIARGHALDEQHPEHGAVAQVHGHRAVRRDAFGGHGERPVGVERRERTVAERRARRGEDPGGGGAGLRVGAADEEGEEREALHAGVSNGGGPASRGAGLRQLPGNPGV